MNANELVTKLTQAITLILEAKRNCQIDSIRIAKDP